MRQSLSPTRMVLPGSRHGSQAATDRQAGATGACTDKDDKYEIKSGKLLLMHRMGQKTVWLPVYVRVYRNSFEHFAVVSKDQAITANATYVNLRSSSCCGVVPLGPSPASETLAGSKTESSKTESSKVDRRVSGKDSSAAHDNSLTRFTVVQNNFEGTVISFDCSDKDSLESWIEAFSNLTPPASPTHGGLSPGLSPAIPRSPVMPTLAELDEEE